MIFASDLDRTLIYTQKFLPEGFTDYKGVDFKEDRVVSYMTDKSFKQLQEISNKATFIPVTTRISAELTRITGFKDIKIPYAITTNGARIFFDGKEDTSWTAVITKDLDQMEISPSELGPFLNKQFFSTLDCLINYVEETYISITFKPEDKEFVTSQIEELAAKLESLCYDYGYTGNKLFILPKVVTKKRALTYLLSKIEVSELVTAGDSLMDLELVTMGQKSFVPKHGEIVLKEKTPTHSVTTEAEGLFAGLEITEAVLDLLNK